MKTSYSKQANRKPFTPEQQLAAAIKNAQEHNVHVLGQGTMKADGCKFFIVPSQSVEGMCHVVKVEKSGLTCDCFYSKERGKVCAHRAAVYLHLKAAAAQTPQAAPAAPVAPAPATQDRAAMTPKERRETAILATDDAPFSIYKTERRYQTLEDEAASRDGYASSDYYQHAYR